MVYFEAVLNFYEDRK